MRLPGPLPEPSAFRKAAPARAGRSGLPARVSSKFAVRQRTAEDIERRTDRVGDPPLSGPLDLADVAEVRNAACIDARNRALRRKQRKQLLVDAGLLAFDVNGVNQELAGEIAEKGQRIRMDRRSK